MIGFINLFIPSESSNAGTSYITLRRTKKEILSITRQSILDVSIFCDDGLYLFIDFEGISLSQEEIVDFVKDIRNSCPQTIHDFQPHQINNRGVYNIFFEKLKANHGHNTAVFYSGNHDHLLASQSSLAILKNILASYPIHSGFVIFPTHYSEFFGMNWFKSTYLGYSRSKRNFLYHGTSVFSFMVCSLELLSRVFSQNSAISFLPRIDWRGVNSNIRHTCLFPTEEVFFHSDGLSHIGLDNLCHLPCNSPDDYNYLSTYSHQISSPVKAQELSILDSEHISRASMIFSDSKELILSKLMQLSPSSRVKELSFLRKLNSFVYHGVRTKAISTASIFDDIIRLVDGLDNVTSFASHEIDIIALRFYLICSSSSF
jgi:hypothetical protein